MKKCFVILAGFAFIATLSTSCLKNCKCKYYDANDKLEYEETMTLLRGLGEKCKDYNKTRTDVQNKVECK